MKNPFPNNYSKDNIGKPILYDDTQIGYILDVNGEEIWDKYMSVVTNMFEDEVVGFEIVC